MENVEICLFFFHKKRSKVPDLHINSLYGGFINQSLSVQILNRVWVQLQHVTEMFFLILNWLFKFYKNVL